MSREWACALTKPGRAALPDASITWSASRGHSLIGPMASMTAPRTATKPSSMTCRSGFIVTTRALRMSSVSGIATQSTRTQHVAQSGDRRREGVFGGGCETDDDPFGSGCVRACERMAHHRQPVELDTCLARPAQHLVFGAIGQVQQQVDARGQPADADVEARDGIHQLVAASAIA